MLMSTNQNICSLVWLKFQNLAMAVMEMAYEPKVYAIYRDLFIIAQISNLCGGQPLATGLWFSLGPPVSSTNKTDRRYN